MLRGCSTSANSTSDNSTSASWPKSKLAEVEIGRSRNWPKSKLAEVEINWPKSKLIGRSRNWPKSKLAEVELAEVEQMVFTLFLLSLFHFFFCFVFLLFYTFWFLPISLIGLHTTTRELQTCTFQGLGPSNTTKIPRKDPKREKEERKIVAGGGKKARNFGPPTLRGPTLRGPTFSRFGASTLRGPTLRPHCF